MSFLDNFGAGGVGPIGGASGPAYSGGSPVFTVAANDPGSVLYDSFLGVPAGGSSGGVGAVSVVAISVAALAVGAGLVLLFKSRK